jgi:PAT family beta-lactamase induction signal transducer AmpG
MWAPLVDRLSIPLLSTLFGRRRSWLLFAQLLIILGLVGMASIDPKVQLTPIVWCALLVAFGSATQDIALDAFRIESADSDHQAALAATYQTGYRLALIWSGAGVLWLAARAEAGVVGYDPAAWQFAYLCMALSIGVGVITTLFSKEPVRIELAKARNAKAWLHQTLIEPFADFIKRYGWHAILILSLIAIYRISDVVMGIMANPFYVDMGYTKDEVAAVSKVFGVVMTLVGAFLGGVLTLRFGVMRILFLGAILSAVSNLLFAWLATQGHDLHGLIWVISADNLSSGIATAAFIAFLSALTNIQYSATQYALFSSMMLLLPKWLAGFSGVFVNNFGYSNFFISTAIIGAPVLILIWLTIHFKVVEFKKHDSQVSK